MLASEHLNNSMAPQQIVPIFSGGGTRLSTHIGIIQALHDQGIDFKTLVGVSGGAVVASMFASGKTIEEMFTLAKETNFNMFRENSLWRLMTQGGLGSGDVFEQWMDKQLQGQTFADLAYDLHIVATDVANSQPVIFNKTNTPDIKVSQAVRYSMSIPLVFTFKEFENHILVDGAILSEDALFRDWQGDATPSICFRLQGSSEDKTPIMKKWIKLPTFVSMLIQTFMDAVSREYVHQAYWNRTIVVNTKSLSAVNFGFTPEEKTQLFNLGRETVNRFLPPKLRQSAALFQH